MLAAHIHRVFQVSDVHPRAVQSVLLDLPGLLFFTTYTLLVLFWAEIYHQVSVVTMLSCNANHRPVPIVPHNLSSLVNCRPAAFQPPH